ncbi:MAG TPA: 4'-phosphopantetheinyl transferase superfamily protein [Gemmatimonadales bacterium]|jgi:4'-phosphopantetheinyl transferase|nr:4'-phosphopantetheinyl transferase superfamily protein [Gemmatimonadales bacterium]
MMDVQCWSVRLDVPPQTSIRLAATLTADERSRSERLRFERDRRRFVVAHGVLRDVLGRYLGTDPGRIRFVYNRFGKPELHPEFGARGGRLKFNLAHSADLALIAIARDADIGVDVECIEGRGESSYADVARSFFSAREVDALSRVPSHLYDKAFFSCWTMKEAYVKGRGEGLTIPLTSFSVPITTDPAPAPVRCGRWSLFTLQPAPGYIGALAVSSPPYSAKRVSLSRSL